MTEVARRLDRELLCRVTERPRAKRFWASGAREGVTAGRILASQAEIFCNSNENIFV